MIPETLERWTPGIEDALKEVLPSPDIEPCKLHEAMRFSVMAGGKRLRPVLALSAYEACGGKDAKSVLPAASGLELLHTYSLVHDDLPAMDDDNLRRGRPTNHVVYGEALAILAGDALQTLGAQLLSSRPHGENWTSRRNRVCTLVLEALSSTGMAGGQALDLEATGNNSQLDIKKLENIHRLKTGKLLQASLLSGAVWACASKEQEKALETYGGALGLAFQIADDILDVTSNSETLGKTVGKDAAQGKATYPALIGLEESRKMAGRLLEDALESVSIFGSSGEHLKELAIFCIKRKK